MIHFIYNSEFVYKLWKLPCRPQARALEALMTSPLTAASEHPSWGPDVSSGDSQKDMDPIKGHWSGP